jgi:hypothetical protein
LAYADELDQILRELAAESAQQDSPLEEEE